MSPLCTRLPCWLLLGLLAACGSALDPVETVDLCAKKTGVLSANCAQCKKPPFSAQCPQCQGDASDSEDCRRGSKDSGADGGAGTSGADGGGGAGADAGQDAAIDGGNPLHSDATVLDAAAAADANTPVPDAGPCGKTCEAPLPFCHADSGDCVECLGDGECDSPEVCSEAHECVQCNEDAQCPESAPQCTDHTCGKCEDDDACSFRSENKACEPTSGKCVRCTANADCPADAPLCNTTANTCGPCVDANDAVNACMFRTGTKVCDPSDGRCVQCTRDHYSCGTANDTTPYVCDSKKRTCTTLPERSAGPCKPCVADKQCKTGQVCAQQFWGNPAEAVGYFCFWTVSAAPMQDCDNVKPHVKPAPNVGSIDNALNNLCVPLVSTCPGLNDLRKACPLAGDAAMPDHKLCGFSHSQENYTTHANQDGYCIDTDPLAGTDWQCTVPCANSDADCPASVLCNTVDTPNLCAL